MKILFERGVKSGAILILPGLVVAILGYLEIRNKQLQWLQLRVIIFMLVFMLLLFCFGVKRNE